MSLTRRSFLYAASAIGALTLVSGLATAAELPSLKKKETYKVGFAQTESNNPWRIAQTESMKAEAAKLGYQFVYTDAAGSAAKQVADVNSMIAQGVDLIFLAPREEKPLIPAVLAAKKAGIPVILLDRSVDPKLATAGKDYVTFIGSDFVEEGKRVAEWLVKNANGKTKIIELEGTTGSSPANDRKKGVEDAIKAAGGFQIVGLRQKREVGRDEATILDLRQVFFPFTSPLVPEAPTEQQVQQLERARALSESARGCAAMDAAARTSGSDRPADPGPVRLENMNPPQLRQLISGLAIGRASEPIVAPDGIAVLMVCSRERRNEAEMTPELARQTIVRDRAELLSRQLQRELRRRAQIDMRQS